MSDATIRIGTAGWSVPSAVADRFPDSGSHLARYAQRLSAVEINSSFYRPHQAKTYARWADTVPGGFRFSVKLPKTITHELRLVGTDALRDRFLDEVAALGAKLGPLLIQLPPSLAFDPAVARGFFEGLRQAFDGRLVCEPRHASWFTDSADALLDGLQVARVAADPALTLRAAEPGGWPGLSYRRLHGAPGPTALTTQKRFSTTWRRRSWPERTRRKAGASWTIPRWGMRPPTPYTYRD